MLTDLTAGFQLERAAGQHAVGRLCFFEQAHVLNSSRRQRRQRHEGVNVLRGEGFICLRGYCEERKVIPTPHKAEIRYDPECSYLIGCPSLETLENSEQDVFSFEHGVEEPLVKLNEGGEPSSYASYSDERSEEQQHNYLAFAGRPLSLFDRLMGRKGQQNRGSELARRSQLQTTLQPKLELDNEGEDESLEIPAFLRRQVNR